MPPRAISPRNSSRSLAACGFSLVNGRDGDSADEPVSSVSRNTTARSPGKLTPSALSTLAPTGKGAPESGRNTRVASESTECPAGRETAAGSNGDGSGMDCSGNRRASNRRRACPHRTGRETKGRWQPRVRRCCALRRVLTASSAHRREAYATSGKCRGDGL
jgi:hypothetical protein